MRGGSMWTWDLPSWREGNGRVGDLGPALLVQRREPRPGRGKAGSDPPQGLPEARMTVLSPHIWHGRTPTPGAMPRMQAPMLVCAC